MVSEVQDVHTDVSKISIAYSVLGFFVVGFGLVSYTAKERIYLSDPLLATLIGIITGPRVLNWIDPFSWSDNPDTVNEVTYQLTRFVIGVQVLFCGISLPKAYLWKSRGSLSILLGVIMTAAWFSTALLVWAFIPGLSFLESLCLAAAVTPTDPVLANSITKGRFAEKHVPPNVRNIIVGEAGANDGLGFPFFYLALYLLTRTKGPDVGESIGNAIWHWIYSVLIFQILLAVAYGALVGYIARKTLRWAETKNTIDKESFFAFGLGLAIFVLGTTGMFGSDDILACFIAGNSFTWDDWFRVRTEDTEFQDIIDNLLNAAVFIYIGAIIPWQSYSDASLPLSPWRVVVLGILVLLVRRPPWVIALRWFIPALTTLWEATFAGFFGPIGVGAVFYVQVALRELPTDGSRDHLRQIYAPVVYFLAFCSICVHGITIPIAKHSPKIARTTTLTFTQTLTRASMSRSNTVVSHQASRSERVDGDHAPGAPPPKPASSMEKLLHALRLKKTTSGPVTAAMVGGPTGGREWSGQVPVIEQGGSAVEGEGEEGERVRPSRLPPKDELPTSNSTSSITSRASTPPCGSPLHSPLVDGVADPTASEWSSCAAPYEQDGHISERDYAVEESKPRTPDGADRRKVDMRDKQGQLANVTAAGEGTLSTRTPPRSPLAGLQNLTPARLTHHHHHRDGSGVSATHLTPMGGSESPRPSSVRFAPEEMLRGTIARLRGENGEGAGDGSGERSHDSNSGGQPSLRTEDDVFRSRD